MVIIKLCGLLARRSHRWRAGVRLRRGNVSLARRGVIGLRISVEEHCGLQGNVSVSITCCLRIDIGTCKWTKNVTMIVQGTSQVTAVRLHKCMSFIDTCLELIGRQLLHKRMETTPVYAYKTQYIQS